MSISREDQALLRNAECLFDKIEMMNQRDTWGPQGHREMDALRARQKEIPQHILDLVYARRRLVIAFYNMKDDPLNDVHWQQLALEREGLCRILSPSLEAAE